MNDAARNDTTIEELRALLGDRLSTSASVREHHGQDLSYHEAHAPDAVAFPVKADEVEAIVGICAKYQTPIVPFGAGTSLEGHVAALKGGVSIDFAEMNAIIEVNADDMDVRVEPGVLRKQLNEHLRDTGLFFPIDPGADASIGGMAATRASGTNAVRYGTMRENVLALEVVLPDGRRIRTSRRARKSAAGYDLTRLYVGSEGTLGVFTEITLKLYGIPEAITAAVCSFPDVASAVQAVIKTIQYGIPVARIELLDEVQIKASNAYSKLDLTVAPTLFLEFHGSEAGAAEQAENVQAIAAEHGGGDFQWTAQAEDRSRLWQARHDAAYASMAYRPGCKVWATDVCVPISRLAECIAETQADVAQASMPVPLVGHVGDGNFHLAFLLDPDQPAEWEEAKAINGRLIERALEMEGTCSGEHGVGSGKIDYLEAEHGEALEVMRALKRTLDPDNLMNPGKMVRV